VTNKYVSAAVAHFEGKKLEAEAVLDTYFNNSVGIGDHSELPSEIYKWVDRLASAEDALLALERYEDRSE
tara:strand:+ start:56 stop:265 length:210 start_codon:yes stop_codon:yes gene_type:complete